MKPPSDQDPARRFERLYLAHVDRAHRYALRRAPHDAEEIVSETFLIAWRRSADVPSDALPWLLGVARRVLANRRRGEQRRAALAGELAVHARPPRPTSASGSSRVKPSPPRSRGCGSATASCCSCSRGTTSTMPRSDGSSDARPRTSPSACTARAAGSHVSSIERPPHPPPPSSPNWERPMSADPIDVLRAADPAADAQLTPQRTAALLDDILDGATATGDRPTNARRTPRHRRRAGLLVAVLTLAAATASLAVAGVFSGSQTATEVRADYRRAIEQIPLPPGTPPPPASFDDDALYAGQQAGYLTALSTADCAWWMEWRAAFRVGDHARQAAALRGQAKVLKLMPLAMSGQSESVGGFTDSVFELERRMRREAAAGDPTTVDQNIYANCSPDVRPGN
jgi:Sigma-70 region 2